MRAVKKKPKPKKAGKTRLRKVNRRARPKSEAYTEARAGKGPVIPTKVICVNFECKLRRAGCYGYEGCPGYKARD